MFIIKLCKDLLRLGLGSLGVLRNWGTNMTWKMNHFPRQRRFHDMSCPCCIVRLSHVCHIVSYDVICNSGGAQLFTSSWFPSHRRAHQRAKAKRFSRSLCLLHRPSRRNKLTVSVCASVTSAFQTSVIGCEDVDDALSCVKLKNGNFSVGVPPWDSTPQCTIDETWDELRWGPHCRCDQLCKTWFSLRSRGAVCGQSGQCLFGCIKLWTTVERYRNCRKYISISIQIQIIPLACARTVLNDRFLTSICSQFATIAILYSCRYAWTKRHIAL